mgnify:FL=1
MSEYIYEARKRIRQIRMTDVEITVFKDGKPVENAAVSLRMKNHQFLFGAVCYAHGKLGHPGREERFTREFTKLMNYTMVPYHWQWYEPERGVYAEPYTGNLVRWATEQGLKKKLHALIWHELCPDWVTDENVEAEYVRRIDHLMAVYGEDFDFFDLANETTVNDRFDNPVSRWVRRKGPVEMMKFGSRLVRQWKPDAKLLYGDWNVHGEEYFDFLRTLRENDVDIDIIGMQSHQHRDLWTQEETLRVMDRAAEFGWPIHFPECSVCSGKPIGEMNYGAGAVNRFSETEEDLYWQADFTKDFYTLVFSHPAVEALSWFDFTDHRWLNAPAGLVDDDLNPKPVYAALDDLINRQWHTDADLTTSTAGICGTRLFFGTYEITVEAAGVRKTVCRDILRPSFYEGGGLQKISVNL